MDNASNQEKLQALQFSVQQNNCCLELKHVEKVVLLPALQMIPGSPNFVAGLMNVHGISVIVIDLALRLGLNRTHHYSLDMPVLLCREGENLFGMIVDHITGLKEISLEILNPFANKNNCSSDIMQYKIMREAGSKFVI